MKFEKYELVLRVKVGRPRIDWCVISGFSYWWDNSWIYTHEMSSKAITGQYERFLGGSIGRFFGLYLRDSKVMLDVSPYEAPPLSPLDVESYYFHLCSIYQNMAGGPRQCSA